MKNSIFKYGLFIGIGMLIFLPMWFVPLLQESIPKLQVKEVIGFFGKTKKPNFYGNRWMSGEFQQGYESFVKNKNPLHSTAIRLKSQLDYSLYGDIMHANILRGKNGYLFQKEGCEAYVGKDFMGENWIQEKVKKLDFIVRYFQKEGIPFLVLNPPLKGRIFAEHLPDFYRKNANEKTNWHVFTQILNEYQIPNLNFDFMMAYQKESPYPLYPPSGQHWTKYGAAVAAEAIKEKIENLLAIQMVEMRWRDSITMSEAQVEFDNELVAGANFIWTPKLAPLPYPNIRYLENDSTYRPSVLAVGDSFYKLVYEFGIIEGLFNPTSTFWYYNREVYPTQFDNGKRLTVNDFDTLEAIRKRDLVILTLFEDNLERFAFGFVDKVYEILEKEGKVD